MLTYVIFIILISYVLAELEIQIEGPDGWAKNLPTWRLKNKFTYLLYGDSPLTGYHFWLIVFVILFLHLPFFFYSTWSLGQEFRALAGFFFISMIEDFFWFVRNPKYGINKFGSQHIPWHTQWILG